MSLLTQVEDTSIGHLTDSKIIDILYVDHLWQRGEDYGKQDLYNLFATLKNYPCKILAIWSTNYVYVDLIRTLSEFGFQEIHTLAWIKLTAPANLMRTREPCL